MKAMLIPFAALAVLLSASGADAATCRNVKGQFAKCGSAGAMPDAQWRAMKGKPAAAAPARPAAPLFAMKPAAPKPAAAAPLAMKPMAPKPAAAPAPAPAKPAKKAPCKDAKGHFIKCK